MCLSHVFKYEDECPEIVFSLYMCAQLLMWMLIITPSILFLYFLYFWSSLKTPLIMQLLTLCRDPHLSAQILIAAMEPEYSFLHHIVEIWAIDCISVKPDAWQASLRVSLPLIVGRNFFVSSNGRWLPIIRRLAGPSRHQSTGKCNALPVSKEEIVRQIEAKRPELAIL